MLLWRKHKLIRGREELARERREEKRAALAAENGEDSPDTSFQAEDGVDHAVNELAWASWYALGIYGWPLHVFRRSEPYCFLPVLCHLMEGSPW